MSKCISLKIIKTISLEPLKDHGNAIKGLRYFKAKKISRHENFAVSRLRSEIREIKMPPKILF